MDPAAQLDSSVQIGPGVVIGPHVKIGADTEIGPHTVIEGHTTVGARNKILQFASLGATPQDLKYRGEPSRLEIGDDNLIREFTTIHRGTEGGGMVTRVGNHVLVMNYAHIAHDCIIEDHVILANSTNLAGHCVIEEWAVTMGLCGVHQFTRIGAHAALAAGSKVAQDVPPYSLVAGEGRARLVGLNEVGLERRGFSPEVIRALRRSLRLLFYSNLSRAQATKQVMETEGHIAEVRRLIDFITNSKRGVVGRSRD